jgi:hypothetical protein
MTAELTDCSAFVCELRETTRDACTRLNHEDTAIVQAMFVQAIDAVNDPHECVRLMRMIEEKIISSLALQCVGLCDAMLDRLSSTGIEK